MSHHREMLSARDRAYEVVAAAITLVLNVLALAGAALARLRRRAARIRRAPRGAACRLPLTPSIQARGLSWASW
jgi:hypothetical protein